ncbi:helix-turn-helix transcriptional regulator [Halosegnis longus]|uniref:helix-turn-helix transcriptional regulator n=1 Tax=Halosegnis longus TaxID=2216012 RepID=UPI00296F7844|nr:winged helix-turn-helix domain-containing protein [Salella cibi]
MTGIDYPARQPTLNCMGDSDSPGPTPTDTDEDILDVLRNADDPVLTTTEVAEHLSIGRRATLNRLQDLQQDGHLQSKKTGAKSTVWWLTEVDDTGHLSC